MTQIEAVLLPVDGSAKSVTVDGIRDYAEHVGGYVEAVTTRAVSLFFDEEGKIQSLPMNLRATALWWRLAPHMVQQDFLVGPVLVTGGVDPVGETLPIPADLRDQLLSGGGV